MKEHFHYAIFGYRWAPESFQASKGLVGKPHKNIPLTFEERSNIGMLYLTKGVKTAIGYVKYIERMRERQRKNIITYGFRSKESAKQFVYCPQLYCSSDASIGNRLQLFKTIRRAITDNGGRAVTSTECDLDGEYHPTNVRENYVTADFSRPIRISMGEQMIRRGPEPPFCPWQPGPEKARAANGRKRPKHGR